MAEFRKAEKGPGMDYDFTRMSCSDCGKECTVPFTPIKGRPVYCRECLPRHRKNSRDSA